MKKLLSIVGMSVLLPLATTGCIKKMLLNGQLESTRTASPAINTIGDLEVARATAFASIGTLEGLHRLAPDNEDGLLLLTRAWAGAGFSFIEDDWEKAQDAGQEELAEQHRTRARAAYTRSVFYGVELLEHTQPGFQEATRNVETMKAYLRNFDEEHIEALFWTGYAWMARVNVSKDMPEMVSELHVGSTMIERVVELNERFNHGLGHVALAAYHARTPMAELDEAKQHFDRALELNQGKMLMTQFQYARTYYCWKNDKENYVKMLKQVLAAEDPLPAERLPNAIAKNRAARYLSADRMDSCGF